MLRGIVAIAIVFAIAACQDTRHAEKLAKGTAQYNAEGDICKARFPTGPRKNNAAYARCMNEAAERHMIPDATDPDLWHLFGAKRLAISVDMDSGKISHEEGKMRLEQARTDVISEQERRYGTRRSVAAQESVAQSARMPVTCIKMGATFSCN